MQKQSTTVKLPTDEKERDKFIAKLVAETEAEFSRRQKIRLSYERQWQLNTNFLVGNQYCEVDRRGEIVNQDKNFYWQNRGVFNHVAPIIETRLAKLSRVSPIISVRSRTDDDSDVQNATLAERLVEEALNRIDAKEVVRQVTGWSETCGTGFYKITWDGNGGDKIGTLNGENVMEGEVKLIPVSPFEIFPDNLYTEKLCDLKSIIHAKAVNVDVIEKMYSVKLPGEEIGVFDLCVQNSTRRKDGFIRTVNDSKIVIERYDAPTSEYPNGRLITVAGGKLLYYGELPYVNGTHETRAFPFVKQVSIPVNGCFYGASVIERLIPIQRAFNAVKNRKHEFINRLSSGVMMVEDGSINVDDLAEEGLSPGKILVYRQGANKPEILSENSLPKDFNEEEQRLLEEFVAVSGVSEVSTSSNNAKISSGSALEILISQDNERMTMVAEIIRKCYLEISQQILRLYAQFLNGVKVIRSQDEFNKTKIFYAGKDAFASDDVYLENENELIYTPTQKREIIFKLYESGLLLNEEGVLRPTVKEKVLALLGYKDLDGRKGVSGLQEEKAVSENAKLKNGYLAVEEIDDDQIHLDEHTRYVLSEYEQLSKKHKDNLMAHIKEHKAKINGIKAEKEI